MHSSLCQYATARIADGGYKLSQSVGRTIAVHCTMGAGLLAVTFDLLPSTLIAGPRHPPPLLHGSSGGLLRLVGVVVVDW